jgi:hypothetical protein
LYGKAKKKIAPQLSKGLIFENLHLGYGFGGKLTTEGTEVFTENTEA